MGDAQAQKKCNRHGPAVAEQPTRFGLWLGLTRSGA